MENPLPGPNKAAWLNALPACTFFLQTKLQDLLALSSAFLSSLGIVNYYKVSWGISPFLCILQREMELLDPNIQSTLNHPIHFQLCYPHDLCLQHWWLMRNAGQALAIWAYDVSPSPFSLLFWGKVPLNFCLVLHEQAVES